MLPAHASGHLTNLKWVPRISIPLLVVSLVAAGCSSTAPRGSRPKLSDAGEQANKPEKEQEAIRAPHDWFEEATDEDDDDVVVAGAPLGPGYDPVDRGAPGSRYGEDDSGLGLEPGQRWRFGLVFGAGNIAARAMDGYSQTGLLIGFQGSRFTADLRGFIGMPDLDETSEIEAVSGFEDIFAPSVDVVVRGYLMPDHTMMALGGLVGGRWGKVEWDYKNPIEILENDGETFEIDSDAVQFYSLFIGASATPLRLGRVSLDIDMDWGFQLFGRTTDLAFENDLYKDSGFFEVLTHLVYRHAEAQ